MCFNYVLCVSRFGEVDSANTGAFRLFCWDGSDAQVSATLVINVKTITVTFESLKEAVGHE